VPLLVVSEYTGLASGQTYTNYVSGACGTGTPNSCPNDAFPYVHDFGSILAYTESNFGLPFIASPYDNWEYADVNAPDLSSNPPHVPLSDFFQLWNGGTNPNPRPFTAITTQENALCFTMHEACPLANGWVATPPDSY
jgi:hypothetical protein